MSEQAVIEARNLDLTFQRFAANASQTVVLAVAAFLISTGFLASRGRGALAFLAKGQT